MSVSAPLGVGKHILPFQGRLKAMLPQLEAVLRSPLCLLQMQESGPSNITCRHRDLDPHSHLSRAT